MIFNETKTTTDTNEDTTYNEKTKDTDEQKSGDEQSMDDKLIYDLKFKDESVKLIFDEDTLIDSYWYEAFQNKPKVIRGDFDKLSDVTDYDLSHFYIYSIPSLDGYYLFEPSSAIGFAVFDDLDVYVYKTEVGEKNFISDTYRQTDFQCEAQNSRKKNFIDIECTSTYVSNVDDDEFTETYSDCAFKLDDGKYLVVSNEMFGVHSEPDMCEMLQNAGLVDVE